MVTFPIKQALLAVKYPNEYSSERGGECNKLRLSAKNCYGSFAMGVDRIPGKKESGGGGRTTTEILKLRVRMTSRGGVLGVENDELGPTLGGECLLLQRVGTPSSETGH